MIGFKGLKCFQSFITRQLHIMVTKILETDVECVHMLQLILELLKEPWCYWKSPAVTQVLSHLWWVTTHLFADSECRFKSPFAGFVLYEEGWPYLIAQLLWGVVLQLMLMLIDAVHFICDVTWVSPGYNRHGWLCVNFFLLFPFLPACDGSNLLVTYLHRSLLAANWLTLYILILLWNLTIKTSKRFTVCFFSTSMHLTSNIGRFSEAGLHKWMPFVIFHTRGHSINSGLISE